MKMPVNIRPMLATAADGPFDDNNWSFEMKLDGYRIIAYLQQGKVILQSRNGKNYSERFFPVTRALEKWKVNAIVDGEVVVLNEAGVSVFNTLQNWKTEGDGPLYYYAFDLLWHAGKSYLEKPLQERRAKLRSILPKSDLIIFSDEIIGRGKAFFQLCKEQGLEGIMGKRLDSLYIPGDRTRNWLKIKVAQREEFVIAGYTRNEGSGKRFSSLLLAQYKGKDLHYSGQVGTGYTDKGQLEILNKLKQLIRKKSPFKVIPNLQKGGRWRRQKAEVITWCKPVLVCEVQFLERTPNGELRHQSFIGLRDDKDPLEVQMK